MYTLIAVFVHFNYFIDDLASSCCDSGCPVVLRVRSIKLLHVYFTRIHLYLESKKQKIAPLANYTRKRFPQLTQERENAF